MADIEKVIKGLEHCTSYGSTCDKCDYWEHNRNEDDPHCGDVLMRDALELLKERLPRKVINRRNVADLVVGECPSCGEHINSEICPNFCGWCGDRLDWTEDGDS